MHLNIWVESESADFKSAAWTILEAAIQSASRAFTEVKSSPTSRLEDFHGADE